MADATTTNDPGAYTLFGGRAGRAGWRLASLWFARAGAREALDQILRGHSEPFSARPALDLTETAFEQDLSPRAGLGIPTAYLAPGSIDAPC